MSVSVKRVYYRITENTLDVDSPPLTVYIGPEGTMAPGDTGAEAIGTIAPVPAGQTVAEADVELTDAIVGNVDLWASCIGGATQEDAYRAAIEADLSAAAASDDLTVRVTFSSPNGSILNALSDPRANMPPVEMEDIGWKDSMKTNGTGAWIMKEYLEGSRRVFKRHEDYYRQWDEGGRPGYDTFEFLVIPDRAAQLAAFITGQTHEFTGIRPEEESQIQASLKDALYYLEPGPTWDHFAMNLKNPLFQDGRVRRAFQLAIDYKAMNDPLGKGWTYSSVLHSMFPESWSSEEISKMPGYNQATKAADIAEAQKLMDAADAQAVAIRGTRASEELAGWKRGTSRRRRR